MRKDILKLLFRDSDYVASPDVPVLLSECENLSELFCINPLDGATDHAPSKPYHRTDKPRRADLNVSRFSNFIFESDSAPLEAQIAAIGKVSDIVRLAVHSANKSVSLIVSVADTLPFQPHTEAGTHDYKLAWSGLRAHIEALTGIEMDPSTKNASRLTRTPGATRESTGKVQEVLHTGALVTADWVMSHMRKSLSGPKAFYAPTDIASYSQFETFMSREYVVKGLRNKLQNSATWAKSVNMYPEILRLTLWAIDATQASQPILREYLWQHTFPALLEAGYPIEKIEDGLINAYKYKGIV